uniref:non-specific serine/threonine protein kinase n=1 Tax=Sinocyclocheilus anshuiensis TaxID=1608454 RepID=A0A671SYY4_9TELE
MPLMSPHATVYALSDCSDYVPQATVCVTSDGVPAAFLSATSNCIDDATAPYFSAMSDRRVDALQASVRFVADLSLELQPTSDCRVKVPRATVCAVPSCSVDVPQASVCRTEDTVSSQSRELEDNETIIIDINSCRYEIGTQLGEGGFGTVYAATRLDNGLQVSICITYNMYLANHFCPVIVSLSYLQALVEPDHYILVLERPMPCQSLYEYIKCYKGTIEEDAAWVIMRQATLAAQTCIDIKLEILLINTDTLEVKWIDFGCSAILTNAGYTSFAGTEEYCPPGKYHGEPAMVWSLGILLFVILFWKFPRRRNLCKINDKIWTKDGLSQDEVFIPAKNNSKIFSF